MHIRRYKYMNRMMFHEEFESIHRYYIIHYTAYVDALRCKNKLHTYLLNRCYGNVQNHTLYIIVTWSVSKIFILKTYKDIFKEKKANKNTMGRLPDLGAV